jgi:hypothetical protein
VHLTGKLAVCVGRSGPGNLHLINGLVDYHLSRVSASLHTFLRARSAAGICRKPTRKQPLLRADLRREPDARNISFRDTASGGSFEWARSRAMLGGKRECEGWLVQLYCRSSVKSGLYSSAHRPMFHEPKPAAMSAAVFVARVRLAQRLFPSIHPPEREVPTGRFSPSQGRWVSLATYRDVRLLVAVAYSKAAVPVSATCCHDKRHLSKSREHWPDQYPHEMLLDHALSLR